MLCLQPLMQLGNRSTHAFQHARPGQSRLSQATTALLHTSLTWLQEKGIGMDFALFYEAYATYYELRGNCSAADAVYQDGINRWVRPGPGND